MREKETKQNIMQHGLLLLLTCFLLFVPLGKTYFFGSDKDWISQHIAIADSLRQAMLQTHSLLPQYIHLGGGSSVYDYAYYGLLRPDILLSCLLKNVDTKYIIAAYAAFEVILSVQLLFFWLRKKEWERGCAFLSAILFSCATCFSHAHYQIIFVNYMPFFLLALIGMERMIKKGKSELLILSLFVLYLHSFYFAISCLVVLAIYTANELAVRKCWHVKLVLRLFGAVGVSIAMAAVLLLPVGINILSGSKDGGRFVLDSIAPINGSMGGLLYGPYGCGMTLIAFYCLLNATQKKKTRLLATVTLFCLSVPFVWLVLNGFLYVRAKVLMPFLPILCYLIADTLDDWKKKRRKHSIVFLIIMLIPVFMSSVKPLIVIDAIVLIVWIIMDAKGVRMRPVLWYGFLAILPFLLTMAVRMPEDSTISKQLVVWNVPVNGNYLKQSENRQNHFSKEEIEAFVTDTEYRFDITANCFVNANRTIDGKIRRTSMYSSISDAAYSQFYYDEMRNAILTNNRVALVPGRNPFFDYFMGTKYVMCKKEMLPERYTIWKEKNGIVLAQNENVLPVCYGVTNTMSNEVYKKLPFPANLEALCQYTILDDAIKNENAAKNNCGDAFSSLCEEIQVESLFTEESLKMFYHPGMTAEEQELKRKRILSGEILILQFEVVPEHGEMIEISLNGIKNKLSEEDAPYPNENDVFTYMFEGNEWSDSIQMKATKGNYEIKDVHAFILPSKVVGRNDVAVPKQNKESEANVFCGEITMKENGYIATSFPYRKGYRILLDGKEVEPECCNQTFLGFSVEAGKHQIEISYEAPGFAVAKWISMVGFLLFFLLQPVLDFSIIKHSKIG